ncbi:MAG: methylmalonyl-CoA mutase family protein [Bacteroidota bacterium]
MNSKEKLFQEFQAATKDQWKEKVIKDLKGADFSKSLVWKTSDNAEIQPLYSAEDLENLEYLNTEPGKFPYTRGNNSKEKSWLIRQDFCIDNVDETNKKILHAIENGVTSIGLYTHGDQGCPYSEAFADSAKFDKLLKNIDLENISINFSGTINSAAFLTLLEEIISKRKINKEKISGNAGYDPLGFVTLKGKFHDDEAMIFKRAKLLVDYTKKALPKMKILDVNTSYFHNAGADYIQELALGLAVGNEYLHQLTDTGLNIDEISSRMQFTFSVGSDYFIEIAKFRAARLLWSSIIDEYNPAKQDSSKIFIHGTTSMWNKTIYDPYVNMLRTSTESMSAILGGVDSLTVVPFDSSYKKSNNFSERIARNQQIILKEEAYFDKVIDPAAGSYYIENITDICASEAWKLFKDIENHGGYISAFKSGYVQQIIDETASKRYMDIAMRKKVFLGTTQYPNLNEKIDGSADLNICFSEKKNRDFQYPPLIQYRGARTFEELRAKCEKAENAPKVFLLNYGNLVMRKARAGFATNFFGCAGFNIIDNPGFTDIDLGINAALESKSDIVVICSSDDEYPEIVPVIIDKLKNKSTLVLAGFPKDHIESFKAMGLQHFIHVKSNVLETLKEFVKIIGIE